MSPSKARYILLCQQSLVVAVVAAAVAPATGIVSLNIVAPGADPVQQIQQPAQVSRVPGRAVDPTVAEYRLTPQRGDRAGADLSLSSAAPDNTAVVSEPEAVEGYATVGVTWDAAETREESEIAVAVRTSVDGEWSAWEELHYDDEHVPDPDSPEATSSRPGTEAYVIGDVEEVQVKAIGADGQDLPADLSLSVVDPGTDAAPQLQAPEIDTATIDTPATQAPETTPEAGASEDAVELSAATRRARADVTPAPTIYSRAQWGANERLRDAGSLRYGEVHAGFVHHTVNANDYSRDEVPGIIRGIYAYHTQSRGWSDIGYNYLVDRFGRIWEGRFGGVTRPVIGAHTLGYNDYSTAMSAIGNFEVAQPSAAMLDSYAKLWAWKLSLHGVSAAATRQVVGSRTFPAINGHRDADSTACPGRHLYAKLSQIRTQAAAYQRSFDSRELDRQLSASVYPDLVTRDPRTNLMHIVRTGGQTNYRNRTVIASGWNSKDLITVVGDVTGDGYPDMLAREASAKTTALYPGSSSGGLGAATATTTKFATAKAIHGVGDVTGDSRLDIVVREADDALRIYPGLGRGAFGSPTVAFASVAGFDVLAAVGDFDRDGRNDLVGRAGDTLYLMSGDGRRFRAPKAIGTGWAAFDQIGGRVDLTNDGLSDILVRNSSTKQTYVFPGTANGALGSPLGPFKQFLNFTWMSPTGQVSGSAAADIIGRNKRGNLMSFANNGLTNVAGVARTNVSLAGTNLVLNVGDWNHDGIGDVMSRATDGTMRIHLGKGNDSFAAPQVASVGWKSAIQVISVGDVTGDGHNDLMGKSSSRGAFRIYPGDGAASFQPSFVAHSAFDTTSQAAAGLYNADGAPDTLVVRGGGELWLYPGNGPGGMTSGRRVASGLTGYDWLVGMGDLDGDGRNDLLGRERASGSLYLVPGTSSGVGPRRFVAEGFGGFDLVG